MSVKGGFRVSRLSLEELEELFDLRSKLEGYLVRAACKNISESQIQLLSEYVRNSEEAVRAKNTDGIFRWNNKFHDLIQHCAGEKSRTISMIANMKEHMLRYRKSALYYIDMAERTVFGHKNLLFALQLRDPDLCEFMMQKHIMEAKTNAIRISFGNHQNLGKKMDAVG